MKNKNLDEIRKKIDAIDRGIVEMLGQRMELALRSRKLKNSVPDENREQQIFKNISKSAHILLKPLFIEGLYKQIIGKSREIQMQNLKLIGFQGEHGAHSEFAAINYDASLMPVSCKEFTEVFNEVSTGQIDYGIVPIENSIEGAVTQVNDLLTQMDLRIVGEINIPVHHCLLTLPGTEYRDLKVVYSHPQALAQCHKFIQRHGFEARPFYDTAGAAKMLSESRPGATGVIANKICASLYHLEIIKENIEDHESNSTRFIVLSKDVSNEHGDKCSIIFSVKHEAGSLFTVLKAFYDKNINLTRIESIPAKDDSGKYMFFLDFEGSDNDKGTIEALKEVRKSTTSFKFLGCYKAFKGVVQ